ncbi:MAG: spore coat associated protein CotJA [Clostridiales bacterium]|nr:spore coat associated protein CotJA [Clostridiales bacterium]MCF8023353.1 spore coat associated protein CotJA [Clostridiales bacterium]
MPAPGMPCPELKLAQVYIPVQRLGETYPPSRALQAGTLFPELCRPYKY